MYIDSRVQFQIPREENVSFDKRIDEEINNEPVFRGTLIIRSFERGDIGFGIRRHQAALDV